MGRTERQRARRPAATPARRRQLAGSQGPLVLLVLLVVAELATAFLPPPALGGGGGRHPRPPSRTAPTPTTMMARMPVKPPQRKDSRVPVAKPGQHDLQALTTNQRLAGSVVGLYESPAGRKLFVDAGVTRRGAGGAYFPVFGMVRLQGRHRNATFTEGQRVDVYVDEIYPGPGRLLLSLGPVYRRPTYDPATGAALPVYDLRELKVGMSLNGTVVSLTENYAFVDAGVTRPPPAASPADGDGDGKGQQRAKKSNGKLRRVNGRLYRLDLQERFALSAKHKGRKTEAVLEPGMSLQVYVKGVHPASWAYTLTVDGEMTAEKAEALKVERQARLLAMAKKQEVDNLLIGESRKGVITKILPNGAKVGIGAKRTGFVPIDSISDAYGKDIRDLGKVLVVGGRLEVEIDEISDDGERIDLRCLEIYKQTAPPVAAKNKKKDAGSKAKKPAAAAAAAARARSRAYDDEYGDDDDGEGIIYDDDEDDDDYNRLGYDDEW